MDGSINVFTGVVLLGRYRDTQCGLKAFRRDVAQLIFSHAVVDGFAFDVEVFHLVERYRLTLTEVPVEVENSERSTVTWCVTPPAWSRDLVRIRSGRRAPRLAAPATSGATARTEPRRASSGSPELTGRVQAHRGVSTDAGPRRARVSIHVATR